VHHEVVAGLLLELRDHLLRQHERVVGDQDDVLGAVTGGAARADQRAAGDGGAGEGCAERRDERAQPYGGGGHEG
jgi:hypothetical protein